MADIRCVVCGEPWDAYGVAHGDMAPWQAALFRAGAGCPACEGVEPARPWHPETMVMGWSGTLHGARVGGGHVYVVLPQSNESEV